MPVRSVLSRIPQRWIVCVLCSFALAIINYKNTCFDEVADIVDSVMGGVDVPPADGCPFMYSEISWRNKKLPFYLPNIYWNDWVIDIADSTLNTGRLLMVVPAGILSDLGYSKYVLGGGMFVVAATEILRPSVIDYGVGISAFGVFVEGLGEATLVPSIVCLISHWSLPSERNLFTAIVFAGFFCGDSFGHLFFNLIYVGSSSWSFGHYMTGIFGLIWSVLCFIFIYHSPKESPFISQHEYRTITQAHRRSSLLNKLHRLHWIPWRKICSSPPFLSLVLAFCCFDWASAFVMYGNLKFYQRFVLHLPGKFSNGSTIILVACLPSMLMGGFLMDWLIKHSVMSKTAVKRVFAFVSVLLFTVITTLASFVGCNIILFWVLSTIGVYILGLGFPVVYSTPVDLSPRHAGLLTGILCGVSTICSIFDNSIGNLLLPDVFRIAHWHFRSVIMALLMLVLITPFLFFGSGERQRWRGDSRDSIRYTHGEHPPNVETDHVN